MLSWWKEIEDSKMSLTRINCSKIILKPVVKQLFVTHINNISEVFGKLVISILIFLDQSYLPTTFCFLIIKHSSLILI